MQRTTLLAVAASAFAALGTAWALRASGCQFRKSPPPATIHDTDALNHLASVSEFLDPASEAEREMLIDEIAEALSNVLLSDAAALDAREQALLGVVRERLSLILDPDYDRYLQQINELTGLDGREAVRGTMFEDRAMWESFARLGTMIALASEGVLVRTGEASLTNPESLAGGMRATLEDPGYYGSRALLAAGAETCDVVVPVTLYIGQRPEASWRF